MVSDFFFFFVISGTLSKIIYQFYSFSALLCQMQVRNQTDVEFNYKDLHTNDKIMVYYRHRLEYWYTNTWDFNIQYRKFFE